MSRSLKSLAILWVGATVSLTAGAVSEAQRDAIIERIKPHGNVCVEGDSSCAAAAVAVSSGPRSGEEVYNGACVACHSSGAGGAPVVGDVVAWADRIAKGMDALHQSGLNGVAGTSMIARGGCMNCEDEEIIAAVNYMVENSQ